MENNKNKLRLDDLSDFAKEKIPKQSKKRKKKQSITREIKLIIYSLGVLIVASVLIHIIFRKVIKNLEIQVRGLENVKIDKEENYINLMEKKKTFEHNKKKLLENIESIETEIQSLNSEKIKAENKKTYNERKINDLNRKLNEIRDINMQLLFEQFRDRGEIV